MGRRPPSPASFENSRNPKLTSHPSCNGTRASPGLASRMSSMPGEGETNGWRPPSVRFPSVSGAGPSQCVGRGPFA